MARARVVEVRPDELAYVINESQLNDGEKETYKKFVADEYQQPIDEYCRGKAVNCQKEAYRGQYGEEGNEALLKKYQALKKIVATRNPHAQIIRDAIDPLRTSAIEETPAAGTTPAASSPTIKFESAGAVKSPSPVPEPAKASPSAAVKKTKGLEAHIGIGGHLAGGFSAPDSDTYLTSSSSPVNPMFYFDAGYRLKSGIFFGVHGDYVAIPTKSPTSANVGDLNNSEGTVENWGIAHNIRGAIQVRYFVHPEWDLTGELGVSVAIANAIQQGQFSSTSFVSPTAYGALGAVYHPTQNLELGLKVYIQGNSGEAMVDDLRRNGTIRSSLWGQDAPVNASTALTIGVRF